MVDVTDKLPEVSKLAEEFRRIDEARAAALQAVRKKLPMIITGHHTDREWMQIIDVIADALDNYSGE